MTARARRRVGVAIVGLLAVAAPSAALSSTTATVVNAIAAGSRGLAAQQHAFAACLRSDPLNCTSQALGVRAATRNAARRVNRSVEGNEPPCLVISIRLLEGGWRATGRGAASYVEGNYGTAAAGLHRGNALIGTGNARLAACLRGSRVR